MRRAVAGAVPLVGALGMHLLIALRVLPTFAKLYADFHAPLPLVARVALSPAWVIGWGAWLVVGGAVGLLRLAGGRRPGFLLAVLGSTCALWIVSLLALYVPIFTMADSVR